MPKDTKTLCIKKGCASVLTQPLLIFINTLQFSLLEFLAKTNIYKCLHQDLKIKPP